MSTYRLRYARIVRVGGSEPVDPNATPLYFRRRTKTKYEWWPGVKWFLVSDEHIQTATEWRTLEGIKAFLADNPLLNETFDIEEIN